ncbi:MAG: hypothetical protein ABI702_16180 [Burkholderiales bacterium]
MLQSSSNPELQIKLAAVHRRRLREVWRSAGWPCQDVVEAELLACGLLERMRDVQGRETVRVTDSGVRLIAETVQRNRNARSAHELLVERVAREMQRAGRVVWTGLSLRTPPMSEESRVWPIAMPDVFSIRHTTVEDYVEPIVHEIKVRRADLLSDLRNAAKREAYRAISSQCWYVIKSGIGEANDIPTDYGVLLAHDDAFEVARPAPPRAMRLSFPTWMALARANPSPASEEDTQGMLVPVDQGR